MADRVDGEGDDRTVNNAVRHQYRVLTEEEKAAMLRIKDAGAALIALIVEQDPVFGRNGRLVQEHMCLADRNLELARRHVEDAVMRAVRHIKS